MKRKCSIALGLAGIVVGILGASSADASIPRDHSRPAVGAAAVPFSAAPPLDLPSLTQQLRAVEKRRAAASECVALCELAAGIEAHPFGVASAKPLNRSEDAWGEFMLYAQVYFKGQQRPVLLTRYLNL